MKQYHQANVKFNGGEGALLCNACCIIIAYGYEHEDKVHLCDNCKVEVPEEQDDDWLQRHDILHSRLC